MKMILILTISLVTLFSQAAEKNPALENVTVTEVQSDSLGESTSAAPMEELVLAESQVPLSISKDEVKAPQENFSMKIVMSLAVILIAAAGGLYFLRKLAQPKNSKSATQISILTQHWLGPKKSLAIVRVAGESILVGITDQNINLIKSLSLLDEDIPESTPTSFAKTIDAIEGSQKAEKSPDEDDFSFNNLKHSIGKKIKNLRSIH